MYNVAIYAAIIGKLERKCTPKAELSQMHDSSRRCTLGNHTPGNCTTSELYVRKSENQCLLCLETRNGWFN